MVSDLCEVLFTNKSYALVPERLCSILYEAMSCMLQSIGLQVEKQCFLYRKAML